MTGILTVSIFVVAGGYSHVFFIRKSHQHAGIKEFFFVVAGLSAIKVISNPRKIDPLKRWPIFGMIYV